MRRRNYNNIKLGVSGITALSGHTMWSLQNVLKAPHIKFHRFTHADMDNNAENVPLSLFRSLTGTSQHREADARRLKRPTNARKHHTLLTELAAVFKHSSFAYVRLDRQCRLLQQRHCTEPIIGVKMTTEHVTFVIVSSHWSV